MKVHQPAPLRGSADRDAKAGTTGRLSQGMISMTLPLPHSITPPTGGTYEGCAYWRDHDKLLVAKQPFLCQRCHLNTRHPGTLYDGTNTASGAKVNNRAVEHACKNCHQTVHGGNAPSGPYLGR